MSDERERPKKSWREVDQARSKSAHRKDDRPSAERREGKASSSQAYRAYKSQLDKLFTPGGPGLPEHLREQLGPRSAEAEAKAKLLAELKESPSEDALRRAVAAGIELPADARTLLGLLDTRDPALLTAVLTRLLDAVETGPKPNRMLAIQKLDGLKNHVDDAGVLELAAMVRAALG